MPTRPALPAALAGWAPGMPALPAPALAAALAEQADWDGGLADLLSDRGALADGFEALLARWDGSDGRVVPPPDLSTGLLAQVSANPQVHTLDGVPYDGLANGVALDAMLGRTPATVVHVSVGTAGWTAGAPDGRVVHLDAPALPPEAFPPPQPATGDWYVVLAGRAEACLASGDDDGVAGQAARLARVLAALGTVDAALTVVATAEAGHAAVRAAQTVAQVAEVVTLGTPWSPVAFSVIDVAPAEQAVRLLAALLPDGVGLGPQAGLGASLLRALTLAIPLDDPARELRAPAAPALPPRAGLVVHAVFGTVSRPQAAEGLTALVAQVAAARLAARLAVLDTAAAATPGSARAAVRLPLASAATSGAGVSVGGLLAVDVGAVRLVQGELRAGDDRAVRVHVELRRPGRWLVGGPDTERTPGTRHDVDLRWVEANVVVPLTGHAIAADARIVLHEARVFGIERARWVVRTPTLNGVPVVDPAAELVVPALPEVRVLLSALAEALTAATDPAVVAALAVLRAGELLDAAGGIVGNAVDHLLHDPVSFAATLLATADGRGALTSALAGLLPGSPAVSGEAVSWTAGPVEASLDLAARSVGITASGDGAVPWTAQLALGAAGGWRPDGRVVLGPDSGSPQEGATVGGSPSGAARVVLTTTPSLAVSAQWTRSGGDVATVPLWPHPDPAAALRLLALAVPADLGRRSLEYLRSLDPGVAPVIDAALDALGLLGGAASDAARAVRLPIGLLTEPVRWLSHPGAAGGPAGFDPAKVTALLDALKPILGLPPDRPGIWRLAPGVTVGADGHDGRLRLTLGVDTADFSTPLVCALTLGLLVGADRPPRPSVDLVLARAPQPSGPARASTAAPSTSRSGTASRRSCARRPAPTSRSSRTRPAWARSRRRPRTPCRWSSTRWPRRPATTWGARRARSSARSVTRWRCARARRPRRSPTTRCRPGRPTPPGGSPRGSRSSRSRRSPTSRPA